MAGWHELEGQALVLAIDNIDTDQLIPARFMSVPRSEGYGEYLLHDLRRDERGALRDDFPLNQSADAKLLITGRNFGSGSSREAAVYALVDAGFRAVIAPSFGDIFASNAINNGLLPACLLATQIQSLCDGLRISEGHMKVSLAEGTISAGALTLDFELDEIWRTKLTNGWDDIDLTLQEASRIRMFKEARAQSRPWAWPRRSNT